MPNLLSTRLIGTNLLCLVLLGCQSLPSAHVASVDQPAPVPTNSTKNSPANDLQTAHQAISMIKGRYVDGGYHKRQSGYDWTMVTTSSLPSAPDKIAIKITSRSDIKKPTCEYEAQASFKGQDEGHGVIFEGKLDEKDGADLIFYQLKDNKLAIDSNRAYALNYYCSGGATLKDDYTKMSDIN